MFTKGRRGCLLILRVAFPDRKWGRKRGPIGIPTGFRAGLLACRQSEIDLSAIRRQGPSFGIRQRSPWGTQVFGLTSRTAIRQGRGRDAQTLERDCLTVPSSGLIVSSMRATCVRRRSSNSLSRSGARRALVILMAIDATASRFGGRMGTASAEMPATKSP